MRQRGFCATPRDRIQIQCRTLPQPRLTGGGTPVLPVRSLLMAPAGHGATADQRRCRDRQDGGGRTHRRRTPGNRASPRTLCALLAGTRRTVGRRVARQVRLDATLVLPSTATRLQRGLGLDESIFGRYPVTVVSTDFIKSPVRRDEHVRAAPDLLIVDEAHTAVSDGTGQGGGKDALQRHELLRRLAADPTVIYYLSSPPLTPGRTPGFPPEPAGTPR